MYDAIHEPAVAYRLGIEHLYLVFRPIPCVLPHDIHSTLRHYHLDMEHEETIWIFWAQSGHTGNSDLYTQSHQLGSCL